MKGDLPYPTKTRLAFADQVAAGRIRWYNSVTPEARHTVTGYKHTRDLAELVAAGLAVVPPCEPGSSSIASLTEAAIPWARSANRTEGPGSTYPEPGPPAEVIVRHDVLTDEQWAPAPPGWSGACGPHCIDGYCCDTEHAGPATKDGA